MAQANIKLEGFKELEKKLKGISAAMREETLINALIKSAEPIRADAASRAPRRTGKLSQNIIIEKDDKEKLAVKVGPHKDAFYGKYLEFGTSKMAARPWLRPAFDANKNRAKAIFAGIMKKIIEDVTR